MGGQKEVVGEKQGDVLGERLSLRGQGEVAAVPRESGHGQGPGKHRWGHEPVSQGGGGKRPSDLTLGRELLT